jgi:hypothetical protein
MKQRRNEKLFPHSAFAPLRAISFAFLREAFLVIKVSQIHAKHHPHS